MDGIQKSITTQARAVSICLAFARRVINGKGLKEPRLKESAGWRHYERKKRNSDYHRYNGISKLSRETLVICKYLNEVSGMKGEDW